MQEEFKNIGLELKPVTSHKCKLLSYCPGNFNATSFDYLGYKLKLSKPKSELVTTYSLSDKKLVTIKQRIFNAFKHFDNLSRKDIKAARRDLLDSLDYITGNIRLSNSKNHAKVGLYYSNDLLDDLSDLNQLTQLLHSCYIDPYVGSFSNPVERQKFITTLQKRIDKIDFSQRWKERKMYNFSMTRIAEISRWL